MKRTMKYRILTVALALVLAIGFTACGNKASKESEYKDPVPLIEKDIPISTMILNLEPEDTKPFGFGEYVYDIELTFANGLVDTFINNETFILAPEVG